MNCDAKKWIDKLELLPHPEGGYYKEIYRTDEIVKQPCLPERYDGDRSFSTSIYFLLNQNDKSHFHKLKSDEIWHFYDGSALRIYVIDHLKKLNTFLLGKNFEKRENLQLVLPKNCWFSAEVIDKESFALIGCTVSPGFNFEDFELGKRQKLLEMFPIHAEIINRFTM